MITHAPLSARRLTLGIIVLWGSLAGCGSPKSQSPAGPPGPRPPPPISGGTLLITHDGATAVAADPDRDSVWLVDLHKSQVRRRVVLPAGSEPGRAVEDQDGNVHVALRGGGQVVKIDPQVGTIVSSRPVCPAPRGLAYDPITDNLHVACVGGELVTMAARGGDTPSTVRLDRDLRDVVMKGNHLLISRFRTAELLEIDAAGTIVGRSAPRRAAQPNSQDAEGKPITTSPNTAWRLTALPDGNVLMLHQRALDNVVSTQMGGYGNGPCIDGIVSTALTIFSAASGALSIGDGVTAMMVALAVDVAVSADGQQLALISVNNKTNSQVVIYSPDRLSATDLCQTPNTRAYLPLPLDLQVIAGAFDSDGQLWVQTRNPALLYGVTNTATIAFPDAEDRSNQGHQLFHTPTDSQIACASCHAEAGDDGHVWDFERIGPRRTASLRGGILATAPFHWDGDLPDLTALMNEVFSVRMGGPPLAADAIAAIGSWMDAQPVLPKSAPSDPAAVARGQTVFNDPAAGCATCHSGAHFTSNQNMDVGTGKAFQVPTLVDVVGRAPYLHAGCAATLRDRFDPACGGGDRHGRTAQLTATQIDDLVAYLETL